MPAVTSRRLRRTFVISDPHVPYHDVGLTKKVLQCLYRVRPDEIILNGDVLDLYSLSGHNADSVRGASPHGTTITLSHEYRAGNKFLDDVASVTRKGVSLHYLYGNHEDRYFRELNRGDRGRYGSELRSPTEALPARAGLCRAGELEGCERHCGEASRSDARTVCPGESGTKVHQGI
jgi:hypothetical protein